MKKVLASREGLIGGLTSAGLTIRSNSIFVALPSVKALWRVVRVIRPMPGKDISIVAPVLDVGPWFPFKKYPDDDGYVFGDARPRAMDLLGQKREGDAVDQHINGAAIDLSDALIQKLGLAPEQWGIREVHWEFVE